MFPPFPPPLPPQPRINSVRRWPRFAEEAEAAQGIAQREEEQRKRGEKAGGRRFNEGNRVGRTKEKDLSTCFAMKRLGHGQTVHRLLRCRDNSNLHISTLLNKFSKNKRVLLGLDGPLYSIMPTGQGRLQFRTVVVLCIRVAVRSGILPSWPSCFRSSSPGGDERGRQKAGAPGRREIGMHTYLPIYLGCM